jgi:hypothetical protein
MKFKFLMSAMLAATFCAAPTWAKTAAPSKYSITVTLLAGAGGAGTSGPCTGGTGTENYCPTGDCTCYTFTGTASGTAGTGAVTFYETYEGGSELDEYDTWCAIAFGDIEINGSKDVESIAFTGTDCGTDSSFVEESFLNGGCQLVDTTVFTLGGASAQCGGSYSKTANTKFTIKGEALK